VQTVWLRVWRAGLHLAFAITLLYADLWSFGTIFGPVFYSKNHVKSRQNMEFWRLKPVTALDANSGPQPWKNGVPVYLPANFYLIEVRCKIHSKLSGLRW
jgi:hypothetical protein